ncbi:unnamed protein product [Leptidea sinapis]|uniref:Uncharacterized protein n=1 Tax=Leptidea sinapis TaxID=189913 RepID=A0A5E4QSI5_9NEOP|nr:unnamed protein product [Leptidea sinapis]
MLDLLIWRQYNCWACGLPCGLCTSALQILEGIPAEFDICKLCGIQGGRNISIEYNSRVDNCRVKIGVWHILPKSSYEKLKGSFGGNVDKDDLSRQIEFERGVVEDSVVVYDWLNNTIRAAQKRPAVFVYWNIITYAGKLAGVIAGGGNQALTTGEWSDPRGSLVSWLPYFESTFVSPFVRNDKYSFNSDEHLSKVDNLPLFRAVLKSRNNDESKIKLHAFDKSERLGHKFICHAKQLPTVVGEFVSRHR